MYYFKSSYQPCSYSPNWYGTYNVAPAAQILLYDDAKSVCIGSVDTLEDKAILEQHPTITFYASQADMQTDLELHQIDDPNVWFGDRLVHRWDVVIDG